MSLCPKLQSKLLSDFGFASTPVSKIPGNWEPEDSFCFSSQAGLHGFYDTLAKSRDFTIINPTLAGYNKLYVTLGLDSAVQSFADLGFTLRSRFHFRPAPTTANAVLSEGKICLKSSGKETDRQEYQASVASMRTERSMHVLRGSFREIPPTVFQIPVSSINVSSVSAISRTGYFGLHHLDDMGAGVLYALSHDVSTVSTPYVYRDPRRKDVVICGERNEGEYEAIGVVIRDSAMRNLKGVSDVINTSLARMNDTFKSSGLPIVENTMNKVEHADDLAARYYEENFESRDGRITALRSDMKQKDYRLSYMRRALSQLCAPLPQAGTVFPEGHTGATWAPKTLSVAA